MLLSVYSTQRRFTLGCFSIQCIQKSHFHFCDSLWVFVTTSGWGHDRERLLCSDSTDSPQLRVSWKKGELTWWLRETGRHSTAMHKNATGRFSYQINSLSPHLFTGSSGGEFGGVSLTAAGSVSPLMVKVRTVQPIQRDLQSQCEKAGKRHNHLFHLSDKCVWFVSCSCGANRIQCYKKRSCFRSSTSKIWCNCGSNTSTMRDSVTLPRLTRRSLLWTVHVSLCALQQSVSEGVVVLYCYITTHNVIISATL